jgi:hypothetical protein
MLGSGRLSWLRLGVGAGAVMAVSSAVALAAAFPAGAPDDPNYDPVERGDPTSCLQQSVNVEQHYFFSFLPRCAPNARDPENASGMSIDKAWSSFTTGRQDVVLAYIEGGINWHASDVRDLADKVFINTGELPWPEDASGRDHGTYDLNGDGVVDAADYAHDPRVHDSNGNGVIDPEDLIVAFGHCQVVDHLIGPAGCPPNGHFDNDHNGFANDISGWDFYDHQNDPATSDSTYGHANAQQRQAAAQTNNGFAGAGVCPGCMLLPVRAGAEALDRTDDLAQAWLYAGETMHAKVIISVTADLSDSTYMREAVERLWRDGVVMTEASNDFDSVDHQGGMFWPHVLPGNGLVSNTQGLDSAPALSNVLLTTYRARSNLTSFGTHAMFSVATDGGSTSESTPTLGGAIGLLLSYGEVAAAQHRIDGPLSNAEAVGVLQATASDIADPSLPWPGQPGWNTQYGYGRPNLYRAMQAVSQGQIPPVGWIKTPDWYSLYDPTRTSTVVVQGHVEARRSTRYHWVLEYGLGANPSTFHVLGSAAGTAAYDGPLGRLELGLIPASFWSAPFRLSKTKELETNDQYTVTLRLRVYDAHGLMSEDRRAIAVHHDPSLLPHFPVRIGAGGEAQPALVDLQARGHLAIVFGDSNGLIHAIDAETGRELPGWPASTDPTIPEHSYPGIDPGHEPVVSPVAVGDLFHDGRLEVVVTSTTGRVYVLDAHGKRLPGWPKPLNTGTVTPPIPRPALAFTRLPHMGATAPPVLYPLQGGHRLDIIQAAWDGHLYAWDPDGHSLGGWPVKVELPDAYRPRPPQTLVVHDFKLDTPPAIADLTGDGTPDVVQRSQETDIAGAGIQPGGVAHVFAFDHNGRLLPGFPNSLPGLAEYYGSAQEFVTEGASVPSAADVDGDGRDEIAVGPAFSPTYLVRGDGSAAPLYSTGAPDTFSAIIHGRFAGRPSEMPDLPGDTPIDFTTSGAFGTVGSTFAYAQPGSGAISTAISLLLPGTGFAIKNYERVFQANNGAMLPGYPAEIQGLDFLGSPIITDLTGSGEGDVVTGGDSSALEGSGPGGAEVSGFPKFTTGWVLWAPSAGDLTSDGHVDLVAATREGYLMAWRTPGLATANDQWWTYQHDEWRTGRYGVDSRPPGTIRDPSWLGTRLSFVAPGDNWYEGTVAYYRVSTGQERNRIVQPSGPAGTHEAITIPNGTARVTVQAVDQSGNLGPKLVLNAPSRDSRLGLRKPQAPATLHASVQTAIGSRP